MLAIESVDTQLDELLALICEELQLPEGKHRLAEERYRSIGAWLCEPGSRLAAFTPQIYPQGSLSIGTPVKPWGRDVHDLDLVCELLLNHERIANPLVLLSELEARLRERGIYTLERKNRCIRVVYASDFHMDIMSAVPDNAGTPGSLLVPDRDAKAWKPSNPKGYTAWFNGRVALVLPVREAMAKAIEPLPRPQSATEKEPLRLVVQLIKRWRDLAYQANPDYAPISIVLTTLAGHSYSGLISVNQALMEALDKIVATIDRAPGRIVVRNPTNQLEVFSERWDENSEAYATFTTGIKDFQKRWRGVNALRGPQLNKALESLFGEKVTQNAVLRQVEAVSKARDSGLLRVAGATGLLTSASKSRALAVPRNTFYGD